MLTRRFIHENWQFAERSWQPPGTKLACSSLEWLPATVPGHVHLDLVDNGVIAHPFERLQELGCQWVDERDFSYRTTFAWSPSADAPRRVLRFEGLDTVCSVLLNGTRIAEHSNMFVPLEVDVTNQLNTGDNRLEVEFESAVRVGLKARAEYFAETSLAADTERFDERSFVRKAQYMYGWDWGPRLVSAGIWQPVTLLEFAGRILDVSVTQEHDSTGRVRVRVKTHADAGVVVHVFGDAEPRVGDGELANLQSPELWHPNGVGKQTLHVLTSYLCRADSDLGKLPKAATAARAFLDEIALDKRATRVGLRSLRLLREPDRFGESFEFEVNGKPLWAMGANWIPDHSFPSRVTEHALRERLEAARRSGMNMLRVWGGGLYESEAFYDLCDELGILVWQDFPFACAYYPDTGRYPAIIATEARANVTRLRNHPSLALWCGNNENLTMFESGWGNKAKHPPRYFGENLYDKVLPEVLRELDPERPYIPTSPCGGAGNCNQGGIGDQHYWDVWHGRGDWVHYRDSSARFSSEYGFASSCSLRTWQNVFPTRAALAGSEISLGQGLPVDVRDTGVRWHDKTAKGYETFLAYVALHYPTPEALEDWVYFSQLNQRDAIRFAVEHYRRSEFCKGSLIWQLNDCWPVQSWALIDGTGQPKPAWFELARLYAPRLCSITVEAGSAVLHAALDNAQESWTDAATLRAVSLVSGAELARVEGRVELRPGARGAVLELPVAAFERTQTLLVAQVGSARASSLLTEPKELDIGGPRALEISLAGAGTLSVRTRTPLVDLCWSDALGTKGFRENSMTLPEPGLFRVGYSGNGAGLVARSLAGKHPLVVTQH